MRTIIICLAFIVSSMLASAQTNSNITLNLFETNLADALIRIDSASTEKNIQFIYNELEKMPVHTRFSNVDTDMAILHAVGNLPVYVFFTPTDIFIESQDHQGDSRIATLMGNVNRVEQLSEVTVRNTNLYFDRGTHLTVIPRKQDVEAADRGIVYFSLLRLPGLRVDPALGKITVDGGTPILMINGKERSTERFNNIDPTQIKRIEYTTNPGIRYMDRGASGIINVVLKEVEEGGSAYIHSESALTTGFVNIYGNASYNKGKSEFLLEYNMNMRDYDDDPITLSEQFHAQNIDIARQTDGNTLMSYLNQNLSAEYTYQHNDSTMFVAQFGSFLHNYHNRTESDVQINNNGLSRSYDLYSRRHALQAMPKLDLYFKHKMKHQQEIEINVVNEWANSKMNTLNRQTFSSDEVDDYPVSVRNSGWALSSEAVYSKQMGKHKLRSGIQYQYNYARNEYLEQDFVTRMHKNNTYLFGELQGELSETVNYSIGTGIKVFYVTENQEDEYYVRNLSMARLGWRINSHWTLIGDVSYVPYLPSLSQLTTVFQRNDDLEASQGNADLKPSGNLGTHLTARYQSGTPFYANFYLGNEHTFYAVLEDTQYDLQTGYFVARPENCSYFNGMWQQVELGVKDLWDHLTVSLDVAWKHQESKGEEFHYVRRFIRSDINASYVNKQFVAGCGFNITPDWDLMGENYARAERQQYIFAQYALKHWAFNVTWHCPFNKRGYVYKSECWSKVHSMSGQNSIGNNGNMIVLGATWKGNFGKSFNKSQKTLQNGGYDSGIIR